MSEIDTQTTTAETPAAKPNRKGGKQARGRRTENRRNENNKKFQDDLSSELAAKLGLTPSTRMAAMNPAIASRSCAFTISLTGLGPLATCMLEHLRAIAMRPLANLLQEARARIITIKVALYLAHARVICAQQKLRLSIGNVNPEDHVLSTNDVRILDTEATSIPMTLAWALSNIGIFSYQNVDHVPVLPPCPEGAPAATVLQCALNGSTAAITAYIAHCEGLPNHLIPEADRPMVAILCRNFGLATHGNRFNGDARAVYNQASPTDAEWTLFRNICIASREQKCNVNDFKLSNATGTTQQVVQFDEDPGVSQINRYYTNASFDDNTYRAALCIRSGLRTYVGDDLGRFSCDVETAQFVGDDQPLSYITAQLSQMTKTA